MEPDWKRYAHAVIASLTEDERENAIAYLERRLIPAGEYLSWAGMGRSFDEPVVVAFVDREPGANWTHRARYVVLDSEVRVSRSMDVDRPPFLRGVSPHLRAIYRGDKAPEWAVMARTMAL